MIVREKGAPAPDVEQVLFLHSFPPQVTGFPELFHSINGRSYAGNTPTIRARNGQRVAIHVMGMDQNFHTFHIHGHRWRDSSGAFVDCPTLGPNETITASFVEDNPGRWLYHCHVSLHQDAGMAGWYLVRNDQGGELDASIAVLVAALAAAMLLVPAGAMAGNYPPPSDPGSGTGKSHGKGHTLTVCKKGCSYKTHPEGDQRRQREGHDPRQEGHLPRGRPDRGQALRRPEADRRPQAPRPRGAPGQGR